MKRKYKKVDLSKMSTDQKKTYRKRLAEVRKYTQAKREWMKKVKLGTIDPKFITLEKFRRVRAEGKPIESLEVLNEPLPVAKTEKQRVDLEKLTRLLNELEGMRINARQIEEEVQQLLGA